MAEKKRKQAAAQAQPREPYYQLALFPAATAPSGVESCGCPGLKPGLDASICSDCGVAWRHPWRAEPRPVAPPDNSIAELFDSSPVTKRVAEINAAAESAALRDDLMTYAATCLEPAPEKIAGPPAKSGPAKMKPEPPPLRYALTVTVEEAYAIAELDADLINKNWPAPMRPGERFAVVAGRDPKPISTHQPLNPVLMSTLADLYGGRPQGIVATCRFNGNTQASESQWWGQCRYGWQLADVQVLPEPIACDFRGGLWSLPPPLLRQLVGGLGFADTEVDV